MSTLNGCGTMFIGQTEILPDGSYVATSWIVAFFIPLIPLGSVRIKQVNSKADYWVYKSQGIKYVPVKFNFKQVGRTYLRRTIPILVGLFLLKYLLEHFDNFGWFIFWGIVIAGTYFIVEWVVLQVKKLRKK